MEEKTNSSKTTKKLIHSELYSLLGYVILHKAVPRSDMDIRFHAGCIISAINHRLVYTTFDFKENVTLYHITNDGKHLYENSQPGGRLTYEHR